MNVVVDGMDTPLFYAVRIGNLGLVEFLVANGADVNQEVPRLRKGSVLHHACKVRNANFHLILDKF